MFENGNENASMSRQRKANTRWLVGLGCAFAVMFMMSRLNAFGVAKNIATISMLAGAMTGMCETLIMYPLENIKTQQQLDHVPSMKEVVKRTISTHGLIGLYHGMVPVLVGAIPTQAIRWGTYESVCHMYTCATVTQVFVAGMLSGCVVALLTGVPVETMKTHIIHAQLNTPTSPSYSSPAFSSPSNVKRGWLSMKGWGPTVLKKVMNQAVRFPFYWFAFNQLCNFAYDGHCSSRNHPFISFVAGMLAGLSSIVVTHPIDVAKTQMQALHGDKYKHMFHCLWALVHDFGPSVFLRGIVSRSLRVSLGAGITFSLFPVFRNFLENLHS